MYNSYIHLDNEFDEFVLNKDLQATDYMSGADISWVAQVKPFIEQFSKKGDLVFDPFAGLGTTLLGAAFTDRKSIGIEINKNRYKELQCRIDSYKNKLQEQPQTICGDTLQVEYPKEVDLILTNFPYFHASSALDSDNFYSQNNYQMYLKTIEQVILKCKAALKKNGYMLVFTENVRLANGNMIPQAYDICKLLQQYFNLKEEHIVLYKKPNTPVNDPTYTNRSHEYVFVAKQKQELLDIAVFKSALEVIRDQVSYVVVGTYALMLYPESIVMDNNPSDLDLVVLNKENAIKTADILIQIGYRIYSWNEKLDTDFDLQKLNGRYYIRATKKIKGKDYKIDITYEHSVITFEHLYNNSTISDNVRVASIEHIEYLLRARNLDNDKSLLFRLDEFRKRKNETI